MPQVALAREKSAPPEPAATPSLITIDPPLPADPKLRAVAEDVISRVKFSFAAVAAEDHPAASGDEDRIIRKFLASRGEKARAQYREQAKTLLASPLANRTAHFGRYAAISSEVHAKAGSSGLAAHLGAVSAEPAAAKAALARHVADLTKDSADDHKDQKGDKQDSADWKAGEAFKKLRLYITRVACIEDTGDRWGGDDIAIGGSFVGPHGHTTSVKRFDLPDDFEDGDVMKLGMHRLFAAWDLSTGSAGFPYTYSAVIALAETDDGGFSDFLDDLWENVRGSVLTAIGGGLGNLIPIPGLGALIGAAIGKIVDWIVGLFHNADDVIGAKTIQLHLSSAAKSYYVSKGLREAGGRVTTVNYKGQGGHYHVDVAFKVTQQ